MPELQPESLITATLMAGLELIAARRLGNVEEARDATQETAARALTALSTGHAPGEPREFLPYVYGILRHVIADMRRRAPESALVTEPPDAAPSALDCLVRDEQRVAVLRALRLLEPPERVLLAQCFGEGRRIAAIAQATGEPAERLRKRKSRALARLRLALGGHEIPEAAMNRT